MRMKIGEEDPKTADVVELLRTHLSHMRAISPPGSVHALDLDGLRRPEITFWTLRDGRDLLGCGALKEIEPGHGEIKSMHTAAAHRGRGIARRLVAHIIETARSRGYHRVSLETGSTEHFVAARTLYAGFGFEPAGPFADYREDPHSAFMTLSLV
jgi:putative acetyltransferase